MFEVERLSPLFRVCGSLLCSLSMGPEPSRFSIPSYEQMREADRAHRFEGLNQICPCLLSLGIKGA